MNQMRLRKNRWMRDLLAETGFNARQLIQPLFTAEGLAADIAITGLGETARQSIPSTLRQIEKDLEAGVRQFILFQVPSQKAERKFSHTFSTQAIGEIKKRFGADIQLWVDTCLCSLTTHGHCCIFNSESKMDLPQTLRALSELAVSFAQAGADGISPSDMMDGRIGAIRRALEQEGYVDTIILSYAAKYASSLYGPFREAVDSAAHLGAADKKTYQMDPANSHEALREVAMDIEEGADMVMVKPGLCYLDIIYKVSQHFSIPVLAYQVSGEYSMIKAASEKGWINGDKVMLESLLAFKRAGAHAIFTYDAVEIAKKL
mgnify:CR=1 FL=1